MNDHTPPAEKQNTTPSTATRPLPTIYKFLRADLTSPTGTGGWQRNRWRSVRGVLVPCQNGLHGAPSSTLPTFVQETLWRVEIGDEYVWHGNGADRKIVARRMRIVERIETWNDRNARLWAADCAEHVLKHFEDRHPDDRRPREAIEVARRFARGEATAEELAAAGAAAWAAAGAAAGDAAGAAEAAAWAAEAAAWAAARAARATEREWQSQRLADILGIVWEAAS